MDKYDRWLTISVDRIIPERAISEWEKTEEIKKNQKIIDWINDYANIVPCCNACNSFLNGVTIDDSKRIPRNEEEFIKLRDEIFDLKVEIAKKRHEEERKWFKEWMKKRNNRK